jgi:hypothetical protein
MAPVAPEIEERSGIPEVPAVPSPAAPPAASPLKLVFGLAIFSSAFLLFFVELLLGKLILPRFGGTPAVWTACLLVFQVLLFAGYAFAHGLASRFSVARQGRTMLTALGASVLLLGALSRIWPTPITPGFSWSAGSVQYPALAIIEFLCAAVGFPFLLLSATSPLLQHWWSRTFAGESPYRLYALSNAGSLLGLLSYPFVIEPALQLHVQAWVWTAGYVVSAACFGICAWTAARSRATSSASLENPAAEAAPAAGACPRRDVGWRLPLLWAALAACASVQLMATTNYICQEVAVIPFLWVLPLCIYLVSLILAFENSRWYSRAIFHISFAVAAGWVIVLSLNAASRAFLAHLIAASILLFAGCMICHGEAARLRPAPEHLTKFFLCISAGGALGGMFVSLIAPQIFPGFWEFPLGVLACATLLVIAAARDRESWWHRGGRAAVPAMAGILLIPAVKELAQLWPLAAKLPGWTLQLGAAGLLAPAALLWFRARKAPAGTNSVRSIRFGVAAALLVLVAGLILPQRWLYNHVLARSRNFYGMVTVVNVQPDNYFMLTHGVTAHGFQFKAPELQRTPTGYYGKNSGANVLLSQWRGGPMRVGLVGMGAGTLAALGHAGDFYRFYEINPAVTRFAMGPDAYFTFINDSAARVELVMGDARMELEREAARGELQKFDVLVLDAFSSDAIPVHLLTREAFATYQKHLASEHAVIAVHITNSVLDLGPVVAGIANEYGYYALRTKPAWLGGLSSNSDWVLLSRDSSSLSSEALRRISIPFPGTAKPILWTDEYSNLVQLLR